MGKNPPSRDTDKNNLSIKVDRKSAVTFTGKNVGNQSITKDRKSAATRHLPEQSISQSGQEIRCHLVPERMWAIYQSQWTENPLPRYLPELSINHRLNEIHCHVIPTRKSPATMLTPARAIYQSQFKGNTQRP